MDTLDGTAFGSVRFEFSLSRLPVSFGVYSACRDFLNEADRKWATDLGGRNSLDPSLGSSLLPRRASSHDPHPHGDHDARRIDDNRLGRFGHSLRPVRVIDGDTIVLTNSNTHVRLNGVDAPEVVHPGYDHDDDFGPEARDEMRRIIGAEIVRCELNGERSYERVIGVCYLPDGTGHRGRDHQARAGIGLCALVIGALPAAGARRRARHHPRTRPTAVEASDIEIGAHAPWRAVVRACPGASNTSA